MSTSANSQRAITNKKTTSQAANDIVVIKWPRPSENLPVNSDTKDRTLQAAKGGSGMIAKAF
jgi:hypothetical protein